MSSSPIGTVRFVSAAADKNVDIKILINHQNVLRTCLIIASPAILLRQVFENDIAVYPVR